MYFDNNSALSLDLLGQLQSADVATVPVQSPAPLPIVSPAPIPPTPQVFLFLG